MRKLRASIRWALVGLLAALVVAATISTLGAQRAEPAPPSIGATPASDPPSIEAAPPASSSDPWGFEDEQEVETWAQILRPQWLDLTMVAALIAFALVSFFRKSQKLKLVTFALVVAYFGFTKSFLISVTNIFSLFTWNWPIAKYNLAWYLFAGFTLVSTVLWGRLYCGRLCAFGALTQVLDSIVPSRFRYDVPVAVERRISWIKYGLLALVLGYYLVTRDIMIYRYVEPFWMFGRSERAVMWVGLAVLLTATVFVRNLYCRFACPVGAALGVIATAGTLFPIKRWSECKTCRICEKACEWGAIQGPTIVTRECVRCDDCERIYDDKDKCVHWLIVVKKEKVAARAQRPSVGA